jgi:ubiquinone/menaquinone biosynthesis C-methylase UbiE/uncharacterized protein YbaR (Trm112 family)
MSLENLRCPSCHQSLSVAPEPTVTVVQDMPCPHCGVAFASYAGVPILCTFDSNDAQTLVEMLCMPRFATMQPPAAHPDCVFSGIMKRWAGVPDDDGQLQIAAHVNARGVEVSMTLAMLQGLDLQGKLLLDVGAGSGADSSFLAKLGAKVVALEPNFFLLAIGRHAQPHLQWLGGSAVALPFAEESIDITTANASLHHHLDAEISLDEMLRVLKPGGWLLTVGDSVKASSTETVEVDHQQWDVHPAVLSGINEQNLRMDKLLNKLASYGDALQTEVFFRDGKTQGWIQWTLSEALSQIQQHPRMWGVMGLRVQKLRSVTSPHYRVGAGSIPTPALARAMLEERDAGVGYHLLSQLLSSSDLRDQAPLTESNRLLQLNGWRWPVKDAGARLAYRRARLFMKPASGTQSLRIRFALPHAPGAADSVKVSACINGQPLFADTVHRGLWYDWSLPVSLPEQACCITLELDLPPETAGGGHVIPAHHVAISCMQFEQSPAEGSKMTQTFPRTTLQALQLAGALNSQPILYAGPTVTVGLEGLGRLRSILQREPDFYCPTHLWIYYQGLEPQRQIQVPAPDQTVFFVGLDLAAARIETQRLGLKKAWHWSASIILDLIQPDPFAEQLQPEPAPGVNDLQQLLAKTQSKLQALEKKHSAAKDRIERLKQERSSKKSGSFLKRWFKA